MTIGVWTPERKAELAKLWALGLSTKKIGLQLGVSKNSAVGMAHRMGLPARPSPLKHGPVPKPKPPAPVVVPRSVSGGCWWIDGNDFVSQIRAGIDPHCREPTDGRSAYCAKHHRRAINRSATAASQAKHGDEPVKECA